MWEPRPLTPLWAFTACYRDSFTFTLLYLLVLIKEGSPYFRTLGNKYEAKKKKGKAIPVIARGGLWVCERSRLPYFLDNRLTDGGEV
jgi:hypothetical protein